MVLIKTAVMFLAFLATITVASAGVDWKAELRDPAWQEVPSQGGLFIGRGRNKRYVEVDPELSNSSPSEPCQLLNGLPGVCKQMQHCHMQKDYKTDFTKFFNNLCILDLKDSRKIGTCCPDISIDAGPQGLAGDLPATALKDEGSESITKITRAENRGCGISTRPQARVMASGPTNPLEWPWMASVTPAGRKQHCGGFLITDRHVITAAHCLEGKGVDPDDMTIRLGEYDFNRDDDTRSYNFQVVERREHQEYDSITHKNDIVILKLDRPAAFNSYVWPICLPPPGLEWVNETAFVVGWGTQGYGAPRSDVLMEVSIPIWDLQACRDSLTDAVFDENICACGYSGGMDSCQGDSGGPLMYQMPSGRWVAIGIVSWGINCGDPNHPGIYTRVDKYLQWIVDNVQF